MARAVILWYEVVRLDSVVCGIVIWPALVGISMGYDNRCNSDTA